MVSKEENLLELFFNSPTREWHFEELVQEAGIARSKADRWLKLFVRQKLVRRIKEKGRMPHYIADHDSPNYRNRKKLFALNRLYETGLLNHLMSLKKAKMVIMFGSFARWDWYKNSDVDVFIYGSSEGLSVAKYEMKLHRDIQLFVCQDRKALARFGAGLVENILKGNIIKGEDFVGEVLNA